MLKELKISFVAITLIQIILLLNMPVANSYQIKQIDAVTENKIAEGNIGKKILEKGLSLVIAFISIKQIGSVSAEEISWNCCLETNEGELCKDFLNTQGNNCKTDLISGSCDRIASCERGCCVDGEEGFCSPNSLRQNCVSSGGEWSNEESCAIASCQKGCCVLGDESQFTEEARCQQLSSLFGFQKDFRQQMKNEFECLTLGASAVKGACVYEGDRCEYQTETECVARGGEYNTRMLCSNPELSTSCKKQDSIGCVEGKDEIYWFDSCGNVENIYSSDKDASWANGYVLTKQESCNPNLANIKSEDCGNCMYLLGSKCSQTKLAETKVKDGNFVCKELSCVDETGRKRANGESWCVYDGAIGDGKDTVGSRHWKRMCIDGEIKIEPCADYRGQICVQSEINNSETDEKFSLASCVINEAAICIQYNSEKENMNSKCTSNNMCYLKSINVDEGFRFDVCLPKYPKGSDLSYEVGNEREGGLCSMANLKCTVLFEKKANTAGLVVAPGAALVGAKYVCVYNCNCLESSFQEQMNGFCTSLGDCGSYVNYIGDGTNNMDIVNSPSASWENYKNNSNPVVGKFAEPKKISDLLIEHRTANPEGYDPSDSTDAKINEAIGLVSGITGGIGAPIAAASWAFGYSAVTTTAFTTNTVANAGALSETTGIFGLVPGPLATFGSVLAAFGVAMAVSSMLTMAFGLKGQAAMIMAVAGAAAGMALATITYIYGSGACFGPQIVICAIILLILVVIAVVLKLFKIGDIKEIVVSSNCLPWEAPTGADNCGVCNNDPLKPCSKYRCESLGQACKLLNEDSENPSCEKVVDDFKPPVISPGSVAYGYNFVNEQTFNVNLERDNGACIPEFASVKFQLNTDEPAQCKFDFIRKDSYTEMENYPLDLNAYVSNHSFSLMMPSLSSLEVYNLSGDVREMWGNMNLYVRCQDYYGDVNTKEYSVKFCIESGPDLTAAYPTTYGPEEGSFVKYGSTETPLTVYLNEPAECKYDLEDKAYDSMSKTMSCNTGLEESQREGWPCFTNLTGLNQKDNSIYIKCKDQPWFKNTANESQRNVNNIGFLYTIHKTENPLKIDYIVPEGYFEAGVEPVAVTFDVRTSGGAYYGDAKCSYKFDESNQYSIFTNTFSNLHTQEINQLFNGPYIIDVVCEDEAGNIVEKSSEINIRVDRTPPQVIRAYEEYGRLIIQTDEEAECSYSSTKCLFNFDNGTSMTIGYSKEHSTNWKAGSTYYIKCMDVWGNRPDECTTRLLPDFFISLILNKFINKNMLKVI